VLVLSTITSDIAQVEQREKVCQLIDGSSRGLAERGVLPYEIAVAQVPQGLGQTSTVFDSCGCDDFRPRHAYRLVCQSLDDLLMQCGFAEQGAEQEIIFPRQWRILLEEEVVHILREAQLVVEHLEIQGSSPENHVALRHLVSVPFDIMRVEILLCFMQSERGEVYAARGAIVQSSLAGK